MKHSIYIYLLLLGFGTQLQGQDLQADLKRTQLFFTNQSSYSVIMENWEKNSGSISEELMNKTTVKKLNDLLRYEVTDVVSIIYPNQFLVVNTATKEIIYQQVNIPKPDMGLKLKTLLQQIQAIEYDGIIGESKKYTVELSDPMVDKVEISFEERTGMLKNVKYYYTNPTENELEYMELRLVINSKVPDDGEFNMKKYISASDDGISANRTFSDYTLVY